jgi:hypothetical protein
VFWKALLGVVSGDVVIKDRYAVVMGKSAIF